LCSAHRSDGPDGLLDHHRRLRIGRLAQGRHLGHDVGHDGAGEDEGRDGGQHDQGEQPSLHEGDDETAEEGDHQLDELADLLAHGVLDEHRVAGHPPDDLAGVCVLVEEGDLLPQDGLEVQVAYPRRLPLAGDHPARDLCSHTDDSTATLACETGARAQSRCRRTAGGGSY
jgi:hypothetical protein